MFVDYIFKRQSNILGDFLSMDNINCDWLNTGAIEWKTVFTLA